MGETLIPILSYRPPDLDLGQHDYDPFAYDVGCLGNMFRDNFSVSSHRYREICTKCSTRMQEIVAVFPLLAPLFDKMTTRVVSQRFTAEEALAFFERAVDTLPSNLLPSPVTITGASTAIGYTGSYWNSLPSDFCDRWLLYRSPPPSWTDKVLLHIFRTDIGWNILHYVRRKLLI